MLLNIVCSAILDRLGVQLSLLLKSCVASCLTGRACSLPASIAVVCGLQPLLFRNHHDMVRTPVDMLVASFRGQEQLALHGNIPTEQHLHVVQYFMM